MHEEVPHKTIQAQLHQLRGINDDEEEPGVDAEEEAELRRLEGLTTRAPLGARNVRVPSCSCKRLCKHNNCACKRAKRPCTEHCHQGSECFNRSEIEAAVQDFMESSSEDGSDPEWMKLDALALSTEIVVFSHAQHRHLGLD